MEKVQGWVGSLGAIGTSTASLSLGGNPTKVKTAIIEGSVDAAFDTLKFSQPRDVSEIYDSRWGLREKCSSDKRLSQESMSKCEVAFRLRQVKHERSGLRCFCCSIPKHLSRVPSDKAQAILQKVLNNKHSSCWAKLLEVFADKKAWHLVFELPEGGPLLSWSGTSEGGHLSEQEVRKVAIDVLQAVSKAHQKDLTHGLLGPDFVLLNSLRGPSEGCKVWGFGFGGSLTAGALEDVAFATDAGTAAPEGLTAPANSRTTEADCWSLGALFFSLLCNHPPFVGVRTRVKECMRKRNIQYGPAWVTLSEEAQDFLLDFMQEQPSKRMSASAALSHRWVQSFERFRQRELRSQRSLTLSPRHLSTEQLAASHHARCCQPDRMSSMRDFAVWIGRNLEDHFMESSGSAPEQKIFEVLDRSKEGDEGLLGRIRTSGLLSGASLAALDFVGPREAELPDAVNTSSLQAFAQQVVEGYRSNFLRLKAEQDLMKDFDKQYCHAEDVHSDLERKQLFVELSEFISEEVQEMWHVTGSMSDLQNAPCCAGMKLTPFAGDNKSCQNDRSPCCTTKHPDSSGTDEVDSASHHSSTTVPSVIQLPASADSSLHLVYPKKEPIYDPETIAEEAKKLVGGQLSLSVSTQPSLKRTKSQDEFIDYEDGKDPIQALVASSPHYWENDPGHGHHRSRGYLEGKQSVFVTRPELKLMPLRWQNLETPDAAKESYEIIKRVRPARTKSTASLWDQI